MTTLPDHSNAARLRGLFAAFRAADLPAILDTIAEDAVWHFPGRDGQLAGAHRGRDAILAFLLRVQALTGGTFHLELVDVVANDTRTVEIWEFVWDLYVVDAIWR